jgi:hypothetical protein
MRATAMTPVDATAKTAMTFRIIRVYRRLCVLSASARATKTASDGPRRRADSKRTAPANPKMSRAKNHS